MPYFTSGVALALRVDLPADCLQPQFRKAAAAKRREDVMRLSGKVAIDVVGESRGELLLEVAVLCRRRIATKEVSKRQVVRQRVATLDAYTASGRRKRNRAWLQGRKVGPCAVVLTIVYRHMTKRTTNEPAKMGAKKVSRTMTTPSTHRGVERPLRVFRDSSASDDELQVSTLVRDLGQMIESARRQVAVAANAALTTLYWQLGHRVLTEVLQGRRAEYGAQIVAAVVRQLEAHHGHGFGEKNLRRMVQFAEVFPSAEIVAALLRQLGWTHFTLLIPIRDPLKRDFYAEMCRIEGWSTRELRRKIDGMLYERTALSKKPEELIRKELAALREKDELTPALVFRDPYMLDFLELADTYSEKDLESAILREIEHFLLELGAGFAFVERQKRIILDGDDYCMSTCSSSTGACDA
jgi:predicted nuclease of restriction endonuclease-like (RecB) superfamily